VRFRKVMLPDIRGLSLLLATAVAWVAAEWTAEECQQKGFEGVLCSSCDSLPEFNLSHLQQECRPCCTEDNVNAASTKYPKARLEVCG